MTDRTQIGLPLAVAEMLAAKLVERLAPGCARIQVAGSVRRRKETVKDVELVCIPKCEERVIPGQATLFGQAAPLHREQVDQLDQTLEQLLATDDRPIFRSRRDLLAAMGRPVGDGRDVRRWGERYKRFYLWANDRYGIVAVDLFLATVDNWGAILAIRTGPGDFSKALVTHIRYETPYQQQDGVLVRKDTGEVVPVPKEEDYFRLAGVPFIEPQRRTVAELRRAARRNP
jgi:DNA polymerase/3'-5' exonuclease PolX